ETALRPAASRSPAYASARRSSLLHATSPAEAEAPTDHRPVPRPLASTGHAESPRNTWRYPSPPPTAALATLRRRGPAAHHEPSVCDETRTKNDTYQPPTSADTHT